MATSSITGLGTGLDIDSLVSAVVKADTSAKQTQITNLQTKNTLNISAVGSLQSALENFEAALASLTSTKSFAGLSAASSTSTVATASLSSGAVSGSYKLTVDSLAAASKVSSASLSGGSSTTFASGGTLTIDVGDNASYTVSVSAGASLSDIRTAINDQLSASAGISANIVTDSSGARLVLSSETTGAGTDLYVSGTDDLSALNINIDDDGNHSLTAQSGSAAGYITESADASYSLDGLSLTSSSNTITSLSGVSIKLAGTGSTTISVSANTDGLKESITSFVDAYNTLLSVTSALTGVTTTTDEDGTTSSSAGALVGDSMTRNLMSSLRNALSSSSGESGSLSILAQLGISTQKDGTLEIDEDALTSAISTYAEDIQEFFSGDNGLINRIGNVTSVYTSSGGLLDSKMTSLESTKASLTEQQEALDRRIDTLTTAMYTKYNNMDTLVAQLNATSESVLSTLNALNNNSND